MKYNPITGVNYSTIEVKSNVQKAQLQDKNTVSLPKANKKTKKHSNIRADVNAKNKKSKQIISECPVNTNQTTTTDVPVYRFESSIVKYLRRVRDVEHTKCLKNKRLQKAVLQNFEVYSR